VKPIRAIESSARTYIERIAYNWGRGEFLLPSTKFMEFAERMALFETEYDQNVTAFLQNWVNVQTEAKVIQGDLFNAGDYPDLSELRGRFRFSVHYKPVTDASDFRIELQDDEAEALKEQVALQTKQQMEDLMREPLERLREVVRRLNETSSKEERAVINSRSGKTELKPPVFRDTVCENIVNEINLLYDFGDFMPTEVVSLAKDVYNATPSANTLRNSQEARDKVKIDTDALLGAIDNLLKD
jgi:hypothetical protein